jgi:hypothetical protein
MKKFIINNLYTTAFFLSLVIISSIEGFSQAPFNYVTQPAKKTYTKFKNPLIKSGAPVEVTIINGQAYLDGDIALGTVTSLDSFQSRITGFAVTQDDNLLLNTRWTNSIVPFMILDGFTDAEMTTIINAMNHIASETNVCFRRRTSESNYIKFKKYTRTQLGFDGGVSYLGRCAICPDGQEIKLTPAGVNNRVIRHEIGHALGLLHEQSREDRNSFVDILPSNIQAGFEGQFRQAIYTSTDFGSYDFASIMHYQSTAFGKVSNGSTLQTIRRISNPSDQNFGVTSVLSSGDKAAINSMHPTNQSCATLTTLAPGELDVNESISVTISANKMHDLTGIFMRSGQKFQFSTASPAWQNGSKNTDCNGYEGTILDVARRHPDLDMMVLVGEIFSQNNTSSYTGTYFKIGCSKTWTATRTGFLICFANDNPIAYGDNTGVVTLTIKRTE